MPDAAPPTLTADRLSVDAAVAGAPPPVPVGPALLTPSA